MVDYIGELDNEVRRAVKRVREVKPQGILFLGGSSEDFIESFTEIHIPAVLVTNSAAEFQFKNLSSVTTDDTAAAAAAVGYLADMGHKRSPSSVASVNTPIRAVCAMRACCARSPSAA